jgi:hypothetical protein
MESFSFDPTYKQIAVFPALEIYPLLKEDFNLDHNGKSYRIQLNHNHYRCFSKSIVCYRMIARKPLFLDC